MLVRTAGAIEAVAARLPSRLPQSVADMIFAGLLRNTKLLGCMPKKQTQARDVPVGKIGVHNMKCDRNQQGSLIQTAQLAIL